MPTDAEARAFSERAAAAAAAAARAGAVPPLAPSPIPVPPAPPVTTPDAAAALPGGGGAPPVALPPITVTAVAPPRPARAPARAAAPRVVSRETVPGVQVPADALQTAKPINSTLPSGYLFKALILVDGVDMGPPINFEVSSNGYYQADRYYVELATAALPAAYQEAYWSGGAQKKVDVRCGLAGTGGKLKSLIIGLIDDCELDWLRRIVRIRGRDLTSLLIDNKTAEKFPNKTASQVAEIIATRRGLSSRISPTATLVGTYFQREHARLTSDISEHDLLTFLAEQEGFSYWVQGTTLHFEQPPPENTSPFVVNYVQPTAARIASGNFIELVTKRNETLAKDIVVKVISWDGRHKHKIEAVAKRSRTRNSSRVTRNTGSGGGDGGPAQPYVYRIPGLSQEQAQARANRLAAEISKHERSVRVEMPFDPVIDARTRLSLRGTKTEFDQAYFIDSIEYSGSFEHGSRMEIHAKNNSPQSQVSI